MDYEFNNEYLAKSLMSLVRDEGNRIVSLGLAEPDELKKLVESTLKAAVKHASQHGSKDLLGALAVLHKDLISVKLPGDFKVAAANMEDKFYIALDIPYEGEPFYDLSSLRKGDEEEETEEELEEKLEEKLDEEIEAEGPGEDDADAPITDVVFSFVIPVLEKLEKLAYDFGTQGNHEAAYMVERKIMEIKSMGANPFDSGEFDRTEQTQGQQQAQQQSAQLQQINEKVKQQYGGKVGPFKTVQEFVAWRQKQMTDQEAKSRMQSAVQQTTQKHPQSPQARREKQHQQQPKQQPQQPKRQPQQRGVAIPPKLRPAVKHVMSQMKGKQGVTPARIYKLMQEAYQQAQQQGKQITIRDAKQYAKQRL